MTISLQRPVPQPPHSILHHTRPPLQILANIVPPYIVFHETWNHSPATLIHFIKTEWPKHFQLVCVSAHMSVYVYLYMCTCMHACICVCVHHMLFRKTGVGMEFTVRYTFSVSFVTLPLWCGLEQCPKDLKPDLSLVKGTFGNCSLTTVRKQWMHWHWEWYESWRMDYPCYYGNSTLVILLRCALFGVFSDILTTCRYYSFILVFLGNWIDT